MATNWVPLRITRHCKRKHFWAPPQRFPIMARSAWQRPQTCPGRKSRKLQVPGIRQPLAPQHDVPSQLAQARGCGRRVRSSARLLTQAVFTKVMWNTTSATGLKQRRTIVCDAGIYQTPQPWRNMRSCPSFRSVGIFDLQVIQRGLSLYQSIGVVLGRWGAVFALGICRREESF